MHTMVRHIYLVLMASVLLAASPAYPDETAPAVGLHSFTPKVTAFTGARIVTSPGKAIENAVLVIRDGRIESVGAGVTIPKDAVVRDCAGKTIYPGFIDPYTALGMPSAPVADDSGPRSWNGAVRPETSAAKLFAPDAKSAAAFRKNGFCAAAVYPGAGIIRGEGAVMLAGDGEAKELVISDRAGQSFTLEPSGSGYPQALMGRIALIRQTLLDARWYARAWEAYRASPTGQKQPEINLSLAALGACANGTAPAVMKAPTVLDIFRAAAIAREFGIDMRVVGTGAEYERIEGVAKAGVKLIVPVEFPDPPEVTTDGPSLRELRRWDFAPENPARLERAGIRFAFTTHGMKNPEDFLKNVRIAVARGLSRDAALRALTVTPASFLGAPRLSGTLEPGMLANVIVTDGDIFAEKTKILDVWVAGKRYEVNPVPEADPRGTWTLSGGPGGALGGLVLEIGGEAASPSAKVFRTEKKDKKFPTVKTTLDARLLTVAFPGDSLGLPGVVRLDGIIEGGALSGRGVWTDGVSFRWDARLTEPWTAKPDTAKKTPPGPAEFKVVYPEGPFGREAPPEQPAVLLIRNATVWTCGPKGIIKNGDVLVRAGKIAEVGSRLSTPEGAVVIDAAGKHVTPGLIDAHSHIAVWAGINEGTHALTSETRVGDVVNSDDVNIFRQLAGGLTTACINHGSANLIGGQNALIKLRWGAPPEDMLVDGAFPMQKFALGENPKLSNVQGPPATRYPGSRMGVEELLRDSFRAAADYKREWSEYEAGVKKNKNLVPPRRDLRLEPLAEILDGKRQIQCHAYRQDEVLAFIRLAEELHFKVEVFIHILEGYKVAEAMRAHGAMPTTFSDWWAYKAEVYDAIPYNGALMRDQGLLVSFNSDDTELARRMNTEAAKAVKYGAVPEEEALKFVTINSAKQLHVDHLIGSIEKGKDADIVIWSGPPLSSYSVCEQSWIDGRRYFDRKEDIERRARIEREKAVLLAKAARAGKGGAK